MDEAFTLLSNSSTAPLLFRDNVYCGVVALTACANFRNRLALESIHVLRSDDEVCAIPSVIAVTDDAEAAWEVSARYICNSDIYKCVTGDGAVPVFGMGWG